MDQELTFHQIVDGISALIENHRGHLWGRRNDGPGATFSFFIPARSENVTVSTGADAARAEADSVVRSS